jgi:hypothetical protein
MSEWTTRRKLVILDFDIEARPLSWYGGDLTTKEITAIAGQIVGTNERHYWLLGIHERAEMLRGFKFLFDQVDMVTGHYIRGFDLPMLNSALAEEGLPLLGQKLVHDTKTELVSLHGMSKSQENLAAMLEARHGKVQMDQASWRAANRLTKEGIELTKQRVLGDVAQHIEMREKLIERGMLGPPQVWRPRSRSPRYTP